jgi:putative hydrolase of the HAD superfamily
MARIHFLAEHGARHGTHTSDGRLYRPRGPSREEKRVVIRAVMFDFGGVISTSPFEAFARLESERGLPPGFIRSVNATNPDRNAWAQLERGEISLDAFGPGWAAEALALGHEVDGRMVLERLGGEIRPQMVAAITRCRTNYKTACLTNNFGSAESVVSEEVAAVYALFDAVLESRVLGVRKPDPRFYELACATVGVEPDEVVFLDDLGINLKPARALGMRTIKVTDPDQALVELEQILGHPLSPS